MIYRSYIFRFTSFSRQVQVSCRRSEPANSRFFLLGGRMLKIDQSATENLDLGI